MAVVKQPVKSKPVVPPKPGIMQRLYSQLVTLMLYACLFVIIALFVFWGAVSSRIIDPVQIETEWGISHYPVLGQLFKESLPPLPEVKPDSPVEAVLPTTNVQPVLPQPPAVVLEPTDPTIQPVLPQPSGQLPPVLVDNLEIQKQSALNREAEQKRLVKVARLYDGMKPEQAAPILNELEDETIVLLFSKMDEDRVAKILTLFDHKRAARLSDAMLDRHLVDKAALNLPEQTTN